MVSRGLGAAPHGADRAAKTGPWTFNELTTQDEPPPDAKAVLRKTAPTGFVKFVEIQGWAPDSRAQQRDRTAQLSGASAAAARRRRLRGARGHRDDRPPGGEVKKFFGGSEDPSPRRRCRPFRRRRPRRRSTRRPRRCVALGGGAASWHHRFDRCRGVRRLHRVCERRVVNVQVVVEQGCPLCVQADAGTDLQQYESTVSDAVCTQVDASECAVAYSEASTNRRLSEAGANTSNTSNTSNCPFDVTLVLANDTVVSDAFAATSANATTAALQAENV